MPQLRQTAIGAATLETETGQQNSNCARCGEFISGHEEGDVDAGISSSEREKGPLFGRSARAGVAGAT